MKKIAVTGATGFIGRHCLPLLVNADYAVIPIKLNLADPKSIREQLHQIKPDILLHLAWDTTPGTFWHLSSNLDWLRCSLELIESFASAGGKRVVIAGSCAETIPDTLYGACKEGLRKVAATFLRGQNVSFAWGRIFFPYGPFEKKERLIPSLIRALKEHETFKCCAQNHLRDFLYVEDVAEAFVSIVKSEVEGTIDIGRGIGVQIGEIVKTIARSFSAEHLVDYYSAEDRPDNPASLIANPQRLFTEVGFEPKYTLEQGINQTINWWKNEIHH